MNNFNSELIRSVKIYNSEINDGEIVDEKYAFLKYVFKNLESEDEDNIEICEEEFFDLDVNVDGCYFDVDSSTYNIYLAIYSDSIGDDDNLSISDINREYNKITNFIKKTISGKYREFDDTSITYDLADNIYRDLKKGVEIVVNIFSNYTIPNELKKDTIEVIENVNVSFRTYDLLDLENKFSQLKSDNVELDVTKEFGVSLNAIRIASNPDFDVYMCSMRGEWLALLYKEDSIRLLEPNVRAYLKRTSKVNAGILDTVKNIPEQFVTYNNGISAVATGVTLDKNTINSNLCKIDKIFNFQIVNGGQTTATLYECYKDKLEENLNEVIVPVKLTVVKNITNADNLIRNISLYSNTQTAIKKSDPPSNMPYYIEIKKLSQKCLSVKDNQSYVCYFERTNGEYSTELRRNNSSKRFTNTNPKDKKFTKIDLANGINCWEQLPYISCQGREKNFAIFNDVVKNQLFVPDEIYFKNAYACIILYRKIDNIAKKLKITVKSNVVAYTIALISFLSNKRIDLLKVWENKDLGPELSSLVYDLLPKVHSIIINAPKEHPEPRMWARKEQCWEKVKNISTSKVIPLCDKVVEFFPENEALIYINNVDNLYDPVLWMKLLLWDSKYKVFNKAQTRMAKYMRSVVNSGESLSSKQINFAKDIFFMAVKNGYKFK